MEKNFKIFVIVAIALLTCGVAASIFFVVTATNKNPETTTSAEVKATDLTTMKLEEAITSNVYEESGRQHIAKVQVSFGVNTAEKKAFKEFEAMYTSSVEIIRNEIIQVIREQTYSMMSRTDAQEKLGDEIKERVNALLSTEVICEVYFGDFFVQ